MTRKDYVLLAEALRGNQPGFLLMSDPLHNETEQHRGYRRAANTIADALARDNPRPLRLRARAHPGRIDRSCILTRLVAVVKRFLVFAGDQFYPSGGWRDYFADADTLPDALVLAATAPGEWWQVVDTRVGEVVEHSRYGI